MQSLLSPPSLTVGLLLAVAPITVAFLLILRTLQGGLRQKPTEQLNPGETLLAEDSRANFFGLESLGGWQLRGNGLVRTGTCPVEGHPRYGAYSQEVVCVRISARHSSWASQFKGGLFCGTFPDNIRRIRCGCKLFRAAGVQTNRKSAMSECRIVVKDNGPFLVTGPAVVTDAAGNVFDLKGKETFALCRCGASANRPFCDGAHKSCGFQSAERAGV
jgi:CDGSH-type Zn-finger protein